MRTVVDKTEDRIGDGAHGRLLRMLPFLEFFHLHHRGVVSTDARLPFGSCLLGLAPEGSHLLAKRFDLGEQAVDRGLGLGGVGRVDFAEGSLVARN